MARVTPLAPVLRSHPWQLSLLHSVPSLRLIWITQGQGRAIISSRLRGVGVHNLLCIPAGRVMSFEARASLTGYCVALSDPAPGLWPETPLLVRVRESAAQAEIASLIEAIQREQTDQRPMHEQALHALLPLVSIWLQRQLELSDAVPTTPSAADRLSTAFLNDIEANFARGESMAQVAARLGVTPTHLTRVCKAQLGSSAADLLADRSLHAARHLLETTKVPAKSIAASLGFGSAAAFSRFVATRAGDTPRNLRRAANLRAAARA